MIQKDPPPYPPQEFLPTMYDLPSEDPEEPGLPDEFHIIQPQLLRESFIPPNYPAAQIFVGTDLNVYYDLQHLNWYKRPDWFAVVGGTRLYQGYDLRLSYVIWQEQITPIIAVELLSPGTEKEDLGETERKINQPPTKWEVYEQILGIPYYVVFDRYTDTFRAFQLEDGRYRELATDKLWIPEVQLGLGLWQGSYQGIERLWLRWYDADGNWVATEVEIERQRAENERQRAERLEAELRALRGEL